MMTWEQFRDWNMGSDESDYFRFIAEQQLMARRFEHNRLKSAYSYLVRFYDNTGTLSFMGLYHTLTCAEEDRKDWAWYMGIEEQSYMPTIWENHGNGKFKRMPKY